MTRPSPDVASCEISVVIPTRNRAETLDRCLAALAKQSMDRQRFEVIVVNDGGPPLEGSLIAWHGRLRLRTLDQNHAGPAVARNAGAAIAEGSLLAFTDDDCEPEPDWLSACAARLREEPQHAIGGHTRNALESNLYSSASQMLIDYLYECHEVAGVVNGRSDVHVRMPAFVTSNNLAVRADLFRRLGGFDRSFDRAAAEDRDFCERWQEQGLSLSHVPSAVVRHAHALTLRSFWRQHFNYGRGARTLRRVRAARGKPPTGLEPLSFYIGLLAYPFRKSSRKRPLLAALLFVAQIANALGFALETGRTKVSARPV